MRREDNYKLVSVRKVAFYPDIMLEGKIEIVQENANKKRFIYLVFDIDEVSNITEETDYWCYRYPFDEMYDSSQHMYDLELEDVMQLMKQMQEVWNATTD